MILNKDVVKSRISLNARTMVKIETQNLIISRRAKTKIERRLPITPTATAQGMTKRRQTYTIRLFSLLVEFDHTVAFEKLIINDMLLFMVTMMMTV